MSTGPRSFSAHSTVVPREHATPGPGWKKDGAGPLSGLGKRMPETHLQKANFLTKGEVKLKLKKNSEQIFGLTVIYFTVRW